MDVLQHVMSSGGPDFSKLAMDSGKAIGFIVENRAIEKFHFLIFFGRVMVTALLLGYGIWFSMKLKSISESKNPNVDKSAEVSRYVYLHRLWIGDSKGILALVVDLWLWYLITRLSLAALRLLVSRYF